MNNYTFTTLSDRYEFIRNIGNGSNSSVYLARHRILQSDRAIKVIPKDRSSRISVYSEAGLLKSMHHPGIPIIYDIEEDDENFFIVEEFIHGESLDDFLHNQNFISMNLFFELVLQLCDIFIYLHTAFAMPVIYQDLKPQHIIICDEKLKLIDFGAAEYLSANGNYKHLGNKDFSAPEAAANGQLSVRSDVFCIGTFMNYLIQNTTLSSTHSISRLIRCAINPDPASRFETVEELRERVNDERLKGNCTHFCRKYAVISDHSGNGCTHFSIALTSTLNSLGHKTIYYEKNKSADLINLLEADIHATDQKACIIKGHFLGYPYAREGIYIDYPKEVCEVHDFGIYRDDFYSDDYDMIYFLVSDALWHIPAFSDNSIISKAKNLTVIANPGITAAKRIISAKYRCPVISYFSDPNPFKVDRSKTAFFTKLTKEKGGGLIFSGIRKSLQSFHTR